jgi:hypothetical protein
VDRCSVCLFDLRRPADDVDSRLPTYTSTLGHDCERTMLTQNGTRVFVWSIQRCHRFLCARRPNANRLVHELDHGEKVASVCCLWLGYYVSYFFINYWNLPSSRWGCAMKLTSIVVWFP